MSAAPRFYGADTSAGGAGTDVIGAARGWRSHGGTVPFGAAAVLLRRKQNGWGGGGGGVHGEDFVMKVSLNVAAPVLPPPD